MTHSITYFFFPLFHPTPRISSSSSCHPACNKRRPLHGTHTLKALGAQPSLHSEVWAPWGLPLLNTGTAGVEPDGQQQGLRAPPGVAYTHCWCQTVVPVGAFDTVYIKLPLFSYAFGIYSFGCHAFCLYCNLYCTCTNKDIYIYFSPQKQKMGNFIKQLRKFIVFHFNLHFY